jgi:hypothetical protein
MIESSLPCICGCGSPVPQSTTGRSKKYVDDAHKMAHHRASKAALKAIKSSPITPPTPSKTPPNSSLIGSDGIDYTDPYKVLPPSIACYMPVQSHQTKDQMLALEASIHHRKTPATSQEVQEPKPF